MSSPGLDLSLLSYGGHTVALCCSLFGGMAGSRTQTFEAASLFDLYEHGLLPEVEVAGMRLKSVLPSGGERVSRDSRSR